MTDDNAERAADAAHSTGSGVTPADGVDRAAARAAARAERQTGRLARRISAFASAHGGAPVEANVAYLGERGARVVLVARDGAWGDLVAPTYAVAQAAVARAGATVHEAFDGEMAAKVTTGPYEWTRMAGIQIGGPANT
jgi:aspartate aminotransferase-like enzyme